MKKIFTLLWLTITAFAFKAAAQGTTCNAEYGYQYLTNNTVKFNPQETQGPPLVTHIWNFGDGSPVSNLVSPTHVFAASGSYPVVHTIVRVSQNNLPACTASFTKVVNITLCDLMVDFSWTSTAANPLVVAFQNLSVPLSNTDSVTWQFGDNTISHAVNPVHTYANAGTYTVCLTVKKFPTPTSGQCIKTTCKTIVVTTPCNLVADFNWTSTTANPLVVAFHNLSVPLSSTDSITWTFGDGQTSNAVNPVHTYANAGTYTVCLRVKKLTPPGAPPCIREICKTLVIPPPCNLVVDFSWTFGTANPLVVAFQNLSVPLSNTDSITWHFGDNTTSNAVNPVHTYANAGTYTVCLRIKKLTPPGSVPCIREICKTIVIPPPCNLVVDFNWTVTPNNPLRIEFHNLTTPLAATDSIRWTFGDGTSSNQIHPVHIYTAPGTYTVCLRIIRYNGTNFPCIREICKTIVIPVPCNLVVDFTSVPVTNQPLSIKFTNTSTPSSPSDSLRWTFGDGTSLSGLQSDPNVASPIHHYTNAGTFTVCLRVKKNNLSTPNSCVREFCRTVVVTPPCNIVPDFTWTVTATNPLRIEFHNTSTNTATTDSIRWTFGDGTSSNQYSPVHIYTAPGTYTVCLRIIRYYSNSTTPCIREICKTIVVTQPCNLVVGFNSEALPTNPFSIKFTNMSTPVIATDSLFWTFGDGTSLSGVQGNPAVANPIHTYTTAGSYSVCLTVKKHPTTTNAPCIRTWCKTVVIPVPCNLVVNFTSQPDPNHPLRIKFTNTSTPINPSDSVRWTFGDGTSVSGLQSDPNVANPTHNYANAGTYTVCLRVKKNNNSTPPGTCVREICRTVVVTPPCNFYVNFSWHPDSLNPRKIYFTNLSTPPTSTAFAVWSFGDGTGATTWNAVHEYAQPGAYIVCLKVYLSTNSNCVREICDTVYIPNPVPPCNQLSKYHFEKFSNDNQKYKFTPDYINTTFQYTWTFGDGTGSHDPIAIHRYAQPGIYVACLTVWRGPDCASTTCHEINVQPQINCDSAHVSYSYQRDPQIPNKVYFHANGSMPIIDQTWTITRLNGTINTPPVILHQNNPVYTFPDTGYYRVCLRAVLLGGCVKEYCNYIRIEQVTNACTLQAFPNPTTSIINVNITLAQPEMIHAYVYNSLNVLVLTKDQQGVTGNNLVSMDVHNLPAGQYTIRVIHGNSVCYAAFSKL